MPDPVALFFGILVGLLAGWLLARRHRRAKATRREPALLLGLQAMEAASVPISLSDLETKVIYLNRAHVAAFGQSVDEFNKLSDRAALFVDKAVAAQLQLELRGGRCWQGEAEMKSRDGRAWPAHVRADLIRDAQGRAVGVVTVFTDLTERRAAERARRQAAERAANTQRLDALGKLAGGVAHDFSNFLTVIIGHAGLLRTSEGLPEPALASAMKIEAAAWRAQKLSRDLLSLAHASTPQKQRLALRPLILRTVAGVVERPHVRTELQLADDLALVDADPLHLEQVVANLTLNAVQAMPNGGVLTVMGRNVAAERRGAADYGEAGASVEIVVSDTGPGVAPEIRERVWEPFFTTKAKGTGLGLATVQAVIVAHGGSIKVESVPGHGARFTLALPAVTEVGGERATPQADGGAGGLAA